MQGLETEWSATTHEGGKPMKQLCLEGDEKVVYIQSVYAKREGVARSI